jgi:hypothetical protein
MLSLQKCVTHTVCMHICTYFSADACREGSRLQQNGDITQSKKRAASMNAIIQSVYLKIHMY